MGYELDRLMNQYGVGSPSLSYSGISKPVDPGAFSYTAPAEGVTGPTEAEAKSSWQALVDKYQADQPTYAADQAAYQAFKPLYSGRIASTPQYLQSQYQTWRPATSQSNIQKVQAWLSANPMAPDYQIRAKLAEFGLDRQDLFNATGDYWGNTLTKNSPAGIGGNTEGLPSIVMPPKQPISPYADVSKPPVPLQPPGLGTLPYIPPVVTSHNPVVPATPVTTREVPTGPIITPLPPTTQERSQWPTASVAAYIRDQRLTPEQQAQAAIAFHVPQWQMDAARALLKSSDLTSVDAQSMDYARKVMIDPRLEAQNNADEAAAGLGWAYQAQPNTYSAKDLGVTVNAAMLDPTSATYRPDLAQAAKGLRSAMEGMNATDAAALYKKNQDAYGFTDADFNKYAPVSAPPSVATLAPITSTVAPASTAAIQQPSPVAVTQPVASTPSYTATGGASAGAKSYSLADLQSAMQIEAGHGVTPEQMIKAASAGYGVNEADVRSVGKSLGLAGYSHGGSVRTHFQSGGLNEMASQYGVEDQPTQIVPEYRSDPWGAMTQAQRDARPTIDEARAKREAGYAVPQLQLPTRGLADMPGAGASREDQVRTELMAMLNKQQQSAYGEEYKVARERSDRETQAFQDMITKAVAGQADQGPSQAEKYFRLAAAFGAPTKTGGLGESLGNAAQVLSEYNKEQRTAQRAGQMQALQLGLQGQQARMTAARDEASQLRQLTGEELKAGQADKIKLLDYYMKALEPQSPEGKAARDKGLIPGTKDYQEEVGRQLGIKQDEALALKKLIAETARGNTVVAQSIAQQGLDLRQTEAERKAQEAKRLTPTEIKLKNELKFLNM